MGRMGVPVRYNISSTASRYWSIFSRLRQSSSVIFHCLWGIPSRSRKRRS